MRDLNTKHTINCELTPLYVDILTAMVKEYKENVEAGLKDLKEIANGPVTTHPDIINDIKAHEQELRNVRKLRKLLGV